MIDQELAGESPTIKWSSEGDHEAFSETQN